MQYQILGETMPAVRILLDAGESVYMQSGGMTYMQDGITMETNMRGGMLGGLGRLFTGESLFMATFRANRPGQELLISSTMPGSILPLQLDGRMEYICQKQSFLCATQGVELSAYAQFGSGGFLGGEGLVMQKLSGQGMAFLELDGTVIEKTLAPGETLRVSTGHVALYEATVGYRAEMVKGFKNILFGGEGLFLTALEGPGKVWVQSMCVAEFATKLIPYIPSSRN